MLGVVVVEIGIGGRQSCLQLLDALGSCRSFCSRICGRLVLATAGRRRSALVFEAGQAIAHF